jgi:GntR family transcriptional regulator
MRLKSMDGGDQMRVLPSREFAMPIEPIYTRIVADIKARIASGELRPGDQLPTVTQLREQYSSSVTAVRNAMLILKNEGLVEGHQGKGVYVAQPHN